MTIVSSQSLCMLSVLLLISGCAAIGGGATTPLPFPKKPALHGSWTDSKPPAYCYQHDDAEELAKWFDKIDAFSHAYQRGR